MKKYVILAVLLLLFTTNFIPTVSCEITEDSVKACGNSETEYWAVIVGISDYYGVRNDLPVSKRHLSLLYDVLVSKDNWMEDHIKLLLNNNAKRESILNAFDWLISNADADDIVVFSFQGHGYSVDDENGDENDGKDEGIVPWEGIEAIITDDELDEKFDSINCTGLMLIFNSCLSGGLIDTGKHSLTFAKSKVFTEEFSSDIEGKGRVVLMSSMDQGLALAFPSITRQVAYGLKGYADKDIEGDIGFGVISAEEAALFAKKQIQKIFLLVFLIFPPAILSFIISEFISKIMHGYWVLPIPQVYDGFDGELPIVQ